MFKPTGIIRRIDDLGHVVIPKELRRTLGITEGDPLEICVDDDMVMLKKYVPETVTITKAEYDDLWEDRVFLRCLEAAGVDNWEGYGIAKGMMEDNDEDN